MRKSGGMGSVIRAQQGGEAVRSGIVGLERLSTVERADQLAANRREHVNEIQKRRQRACEVFYEGADTDGGNVPDEAIEVATRVKITPEIIEAWQRGANIDGLPNRTRDGLKAAFEAAGFEVER